MKTINIFGETQREQWHSVVNMLRLLGGDLTLQGRSELCGELDRYIDAMEDLNEQAAREKTVVYALVRTEYIESCMNSDVMLYSDIEDAKKEMLRQYEEIIAVWKHDRQTNSFDYWCTFEEHDATVCEYFDEVRWKIEERIVDAEQKGE